MSCECYKLGYNRADPNCPTHGQEAQKKQESERALLLRISELERKVENLQTKVQRLELKNWTADL